MSKMVSAFFEGLVLTLFSFSPLMLKSADFMTGDRVVVDTVVNEDVYISCKTLQVNAPIKGDLVVAAQTLILRDSVLGDLIAAAERIEIYGPVLDDMRIFARSLELSGVIKGDVIVFGAEVTVTRETVMEGDLIVFAGEVVNEGLIKGNVEIRGGTVKLAGKVNGDLKVESGELEVNSVVAGASILSAQNISIGDRAMFQKEIRYWQEGGRLKISASQHSAALKFDTSLASGNNSKNNWYVLGGAFLFLQILFGILMIFVFNLLFHSFFNRGGFNLQKDSVKSFGYGVLYFLVTPLLVLICLITVVGIPLGLFVMFLFIFTLIFANVVTALVITYYLNHKLQKNWSRGQITGISFLVYLGLKIISIIPLAGLLLIILLISAAFGSLLIGMRERQAALSAA